MPGDTKTYRARLARKGKRRPEPGTVADLQRLLWRALVHLEDHLEAVAEAGEPDPNSLCRLTHAVSQAAGVYLKVIETGELEARLSALEQAQAALGPDPGARLPA